MFFSIKNDHRCTVRENSPLFTDISYYQITIKLKDYGNAHFFEVRFRYEKVMENGSNKNVTENYLVDALSFTEAEARIITEMEPFVTGDFKVKAVKQANYTELFSSNDVNSDVWYKVRLAYVTLDNKSGAEKKTYTNILVQASDLRDAVRRLDEGMKGTMSDYRIVSVSETKIMDVYLYKPEAEA